MRVSNSMILITVPNLLDQGGVANYYNSVLPFFPKEKVVAVEVGSGSRNGRLLHSVVDQFLFCSSVKNNQPDLVHINPSLGFKCLIRDGLFAWQSKLMGLPLLVFWHGWDKSFEEVLEKRFLWFFRRTFGRADAHIVLASEFEQKLRHWGVDVAIYRETTNVADELIGEFDISDKWSDWLNGGRERVKILFLARLERAKGVFETVEAVKLLNENGIAVSLTVAGDGAIRQELEKYTRKDLGMDEQQVVFTGDIRGVDKVRVFIEHHVYCLPSYSEGLPASVLEAMAFGMPVVTRSVGGLADIFVDEKMGRLVQEKRPHEIAACLEWLINDRSRMVEIGRNNAVYAKENFMASSVACRLSDIYVRIIPDM